MKILLIQFKKSAALVSSLLAAALTAILLAPNLSQNGAQQSLEQFLPEKVGGWQVVNTSTIQVGLSTDTGIDQPYDQTVMRSYINPHGKVLHLAVAWGQKQRQEVKIHRPELCYPAQGFEVISLENTTFAVAQANPVTGKRMVRNRYGQLEAVSYWIRIGSIYSDSPWQTRKHILLEGLSGHLLDGVLVRVSQPVGTQAQLEHAFKLQEEFAARLVADTRPPARAMLVK